MRIIVYGSLQRKQGNCHWMTNAQWLGDYTIPGYELYDLGHYPAAVSGNGAVYGEVYRIDSTTLAELDVLRTKSGEYKLILIGTALRQRLDVSLSAASYRSYAVAGRD